MCMFLCFSALRCIWPIIRWVEGLVCRRLGTRSGVEARKWGETFLFLAVWLLLGYKRRHCACYSVQKERTFESKTIPHIIASLPLNVLCPCKTESLCKTSCNTKQLNHICSGGNFSILECPCLYSCAIVAVLGVVLDRTYWDSGYEMVGCNYWLWFAYPKWL